MEDRISRVVSEIRFPVIREMSLRAQGLENVISLGIGEPDFDTPSGICQKALEDALSGATHYVPSQGDPELLETLCGYLNERFGYDLSTSNILITGGGMGALTAYFRTILNSGDEVLVPEPHFPEYRPQIEWAGGRVVYVHTSLEQGFAVTPEALERAITPRSKVLVLNYPNNPTGAVMNGTSLDDLAQFALEKDLLVVSDEVYDRMLFDGVQHDSIASRKGMFDRTTVIGSFSKAFAMTGWRIGYAYGPEWIVSEMTKVVSYCTSCAPAVSQRAAFAALQQDSSVVTEMVEEFRVRRDLVYEALSPLPGVRVHKPGGTFYIFPNVEEITDDEEKFALDLLEKERVVVIPGSAFGPSGSGSIRIAFTLDRSLLTEAMERFSSFVRDRVS